MMEMLLLVKNGWSNFNKKLLWTTMARVAHFPQKTSQYSTFYEKFFTIDDHPIPSSANHDVANKKMWWTSKKLMVTNLAEVAQFEGRGESVNQCSFPIFS